MPYVPISAQGFQLATVLQNSSWLSASALISLLNTLNATDLTSPTSKTESLNALKAALGPAPYTIPDGSPDHMVPVRFSAQSGTVQPAAYYACRDAANWHEVFADLFSSLSTLPPSDPADDPARATFYQALDNYTHALSDPNSLFNYVTFESFYRILWT